MKMFRDRPQGEQDAYVEGVWDTVTWLGSMFVIIFVLAFLV